MATKKRQGDAFEKSVAEALAHVRVGHHARAWKILQPWQHMVPEEHDAPAPPSHEAVLRLRVATLIAEIAERHGDNYALSKRTLLPLTRIAEDVKEVDRTKKPQVGAGKNLEWHYLRQKLYYVWQLSVLRYRTGDLMNSNRDLHLALRLAEQLDPRPEPLLANLYYGAGKLALRELDYTHATSMFRRSIASASRGLAAARRRGMNVELAERAAQYNIAKAVTFGMGHCLREQGRVEEAHALIVAGQLQLSLGHDRVLADLAELLLASVERGAAGERNAVYLDAAANHLEECTRAFENHRGDAGYQWRYERALLKMQRGELHEAEKEICDLIEIVKGRNDRWFADAHGALSRIQRRLHLYDEAVASAHMAVDTAVTRGIRDVGQRARAMLIAALYEKATVDRLQRVQLLDEAEKEIRRARQSLHEEDIRNRANLRLQEARVLNARGGRRAEAERAFQDYLAIRSFIDVGRIREFEEVVRTELEGGRHTCLADGKNPDYNLSNNRDHLDAYIMKKVLDRGLSIGEQTQALGISKGQFYTRLKELGIPTPSEQRKAKQKVARRHDSGDAEEMPSAGVVIGRAGGI